VRKQSEPGEHEVDWNSNEERNREESSRANEAGMKSAFSLGGKDMRIPLLDDGGEIENEDVYIGDESRKHIPNPRGYEERSSEDQDNSQIAPMSVPMNNSNGQPARMDVSNPERSSVLRMPRIGDASMEQRPAEDDADQRAISDHRKAADELGDKSLQNGDLIGLGKANIAHTQLSKAEGRLASTQKIESVYQPDQNETYDRPTSPASDAPQTQGGRIEAPSGNAQAALDQQRRVGPEDPSKLPIISPDHRAATALGGIPKIESAPDTQGISPLVGNRSQFIEPMQATPTVAKYKDQLKSIDQQILQAEGQGTPEGREKADNLRLYKQDLQSNNPYGSENNHPGALGKFEHVLGRIGNIAGNLAGAPEMSMIPGTDLYKQGQRASYLGRIGEANKEELSKSEAVKNLAAGKAAPKDWQEVTGGAVDPRHPELGQQQSFYDKTNPNQRVYAGPIAPKEDAKSKPLGAEGVKNSNAGFNDRYQILHPNETLPAQYTLPANATEEDFDRVDKQMQQVVGAQGTKAQQDQARAIQASAAAESKRRWEDTQGQKLVNYRVGDGPLRSGTREEAQQAGGRLFGATTAAEQQKAREFYTQTGRLLENAEVAMGTLPAWKNETNRKAAMDVSKNYWDSVHASLGIAGMAISPDHMQIILNSDAYRSMDGKGREHMQNMMQLWSDAINLAKLETGSSRAVQAVIEKEERIMPSADKTSAMNQQALLSLAKRLNTDASEHAQPSDMKSLPETIAHVQKIGGQEVQVDRDGTFELNGHTYHMNPDGKGGKLIK
jgi:hypothetical protein